MKDVPWGPAGWPTGAEVQRLRGPRAGRAAEGLDATWRGLDEGLAPPAGVVAALEEAGGVWPPRAGDAPVPVDEVPPTDVLTRVALDVAPDAGGDAPREALGPYARGLDLRDPWQRRAWASAVAALALCVPEGDPRSPYKAWLRDRERPQGALHDGAVALGRAPWGAWRLDEVDGHEVVVSPLLPAREPWCPRGPIDLGDAGGVRGGPRQGGMLLARLVPCGTGWATRLGLLLPVAPSAELARGWLAAVAFPLLAATPELSLEDVLRRGGHRVVAQAHRWAWARGD